MSLPKAAAQEPPQDPSQESTPDPAQQQPEQSQPQASPQELNQNQPNQDSRATIRGSVRNALTGDPLPRALVQIEGDAQTGTLTDGEGRFELTNVPTGAQTIRVVKPGFRDRPYATEDDSLQAEGPGHSVLVAAQTPDLNFALTPSSVIHGRVELSTGDPAENISLALFHQVVQLGRARWTQIAAAQTNGDGAYRFANLPEGVYVLSTLPTLESEPAATVIVPTSAASIVRSGYAETYYPDAREFAGAARIRLSAGAQAEANLSLSLEPFYPVSAAVLMPNGRPAGSEAPGGNTALVLDTSGHAIPDYPQYDPTTHTLQVSLPDGNYSLLIHTVAQTQFVGRVSQHSGAELAGSVPFTVAGHAVTNLKIPLATPPKNLIHVRLVRSVGSKGPIAADSPADLVNLSLNSADPGSNEGVWSLAAHEDTIDLTAQPGSYWLSPILERKGICAGSFTSGSVNLGREPLTIGLAAPAPIELVIREDCATLALALPASAATFLPGEEPFYTVYVVPDFDAVTDIPPMTVHPSSGPGVTLDSLTPGNYHVYTFSTPFHLEYRNPAAMATLSTPGQPVTLSAGATTNLTLEASQN